MKLAEGTEKVPVKVGDRVGIKWISEACLTCRMFSAPRCLSSSRYTSHALRIMRMSFFRALLLHIRIHTHLACRATRRCRRIPRTSKLIRRFPFRQRRAPKAWRASASIRRLAGIPRRARFSNTSSGLQSMYIYIPLFLFASPPLTPFPAPPL